MQRVDYVNCPHCHGSFSFSKPDTGGNCPFCKKCIFEQQQQNNTATVPTDAPGSATLTGDEAMLSRVMDGFDTKTIVTAAAAHALVRSDLDLAQRLMDCLVEK